MTQMTPGSMQAFTDLSVVIGWWWTGGDGGSDDDDDGTGDNRLTTIPPEVGQLALLEELKSNQNQLTKPTSEIGQLSSLKVYIVLITAIAARLEHDERIM